MKFEDFLTQSSEQQSRRIALEEEVEELQHRLTNELELNNVLRYALKGPVISCPRFPSFLPLKVQTLLVEVDMIEKEIIWLETKLKKVKRSLYIEKRVNKEAVIMHKRKRLEMQLPCRHQIQSEGKDMGVWSPFHKMHNVIIFPNIHVCKR